MAQSAENGLSPLVIVASYRLLTVTALSNNYTDKLEVLKNTPLCNERAMYYVSVGFKRFQK